MRAEQVVLHGAGAVENHSKVCVVIIKTRPHYMKSNDWTETLIARLKYDPDTMEWQLYWMRASGKWEKYAWLKPTKNLQSLVDGIARDYHGAFWGRMSEESLRLFLKSKPKGKWE